jgi:hypothetical protein
MPLGNGQKAPPIDPTKNVLDLVEAAIRRQDDLRAAETRRVNELAELKEKHDRIVADILTEQVKSTSQLISTQLDRLTTTMTERIAALERFRWEVGGKQQGIGTVVLAITTGLSVVIAFGGLAVALFRH